MKAATSRRTPKKLAVTDRAVHEGINFCFGVWDGHDSIRSLFVTFQTPAHRLIDHTADPVHILNISVTRLTRDVRINMRHVVEINRSRSRETVNTLPFRLCLFFCVVQDLLNLWRIAFDLLMTERTFFRTGDQHMRRSPFAVFVTEPTSDLQLIGMYAVTVFNRLHRCVDAASRCGIDDRSHDRDENYSSQNEPFASQDLFPHVFGFCGLGR